jgi:hypothetical protein
VPRAAQFRQRNRIQLCAQRPVLDLVFTARHRHSIMPPGGGPEALRLAGGRVRGCAAGSRGLSSGAGFIADPALQGWGDSGVRVPAVSEHLPVASPLSTVARYGCRECRPGSVRALRCGQIISVVD